MPHSARRRNHLVDVSKSLGPKTILGQSDLWVVGSKVFGFQCLWVKESWSEIVRYNSLKLLFFGQNVVAKKIKSRLVYIKCCQHLLVATGSFLMNERASYKIKISLLLGLNGGKMLFWW